MPALCEPRLRGQVWKQESSCSKARRVVQARGVLASARAWPQGWGEGASGRQLGDRAGGPR